MFRLISLGYHLNMDIRKTIISKISNIIFLISTILVLSFIWINYYLRNMNNSIVVSILITIIFCFIYFPIKATLNMKKNSEHNIESEKNATKTQLLLSNDSIVSSILLDAFNINATQDNSSQHYVDINNEVDVFFLFNSQILNEEDIIRVYKTKHFNHIKIFCIEKINFPQDKNCTFEILELNEIYNALKQQNIVFPTTYNIKNKPKLSLKLILCTLFNSKKSKGYFWFGLMLIFSSLFTPFQIYYIVSGTILILIAVFSRFNKIYN